MLKDYVLPHVSDPETLSELFYDVLYGDLMSRFTLIRESDMKPVATICYTVYRDFEDLANNIFGMFGTDIDRVIPKNNEVVRGAKRIVVISYFYIEPDSRKTSVRRTILDEFFQLYENYMVVETSSATYDTIWSKEDFVRIYGSKDTLILAFRQP